jgi:hypothetical protein
MTINQNNVGVSTEQLSRAPVISWKVSNYSVVWDLETPNFNLILILTTSLIF